VLNQSSNSNSSSNVASDRGGVLDFICSGMHLVPHCRVPVPLLLRFQVFQKPATYGNSGGFSVSISACL
jgi:hypothetical protein